MHKGNLYACLKGVLDAGVDIPAQDEFFPDEKRITGAHIGAYSAHAKGTQFGKSKDAAKDAVAKAADAAKDAAGKAADAAKDAAAKAADAVKKP